MDIEETIYKYALTNAVEHGNKCQTGSVIGMVMSKNPEMRKDPKTVSQLAGKLTAKVNGLSPEEQASELEKYGGLEEHKRAPEKPKGLPELEAPEGKQITLRFAPNPSGPLHIGHARAAILNMLYQKKYDGKLILRIEDTDPKRVEVDAYDSIPADIEWLGIEPDETYIQSDRIEIYYDYARKAIEIGAAYMCTCDGGDFKKLKDECKPCPCRSHTVEENMELWDKFGDMEEGEAVLRVKTDINHKNPAIRDWVAMRIVDQEHPRIGNKYRIYPMMNFSVTIDDHLLGMTHVLRGKDHLANSEKQAYLYKHFGWDIPEFIHYGRLKMDDVLLSTSKAREGIASGKYTGWDDPRLGTIQAIARRGIKKESLYDLIEEIGTKQADATISWKKIYGLNRNIIEENTNRYFFIPNPVKVDIANIPEDKQELSISRELHYNQPEKGMRTLNFNGSAYIPQDDYDKAISQNKPLRLMDLVNINVDSDSAVYDSETLEEAQSKHALIIQWVPTEDAIKAKVVMPDNTVTEGYIEADSSSVKVDDMVQLERFGFARVDNVTSDEITFYYTHN
ncbi:glutamate--tRNA ligase [Methanosphaera sp. WGK6]|uniref:glutamate--tRNA ligase n=1 Tax=Methanosphaera sp. WGK6 TaxID=1561964 RepID=UPI00084C2B9E|nr:glutamate--tRNA ligase [Methanosphaera sp. WGK6]OED29810.1 glutamyl-tRNA ligase [Methanosphaera sp. WGK6]